jgi:methanogenic corrinoid protein MtbC1
LFFKKRLKTKTLLNPIDNLPQTCQTRKSQEKSQIASSRGKQAAKVIDEGLRFSFDV